MSLIRSAVSRKARARWATWSASVFAKPDGWSESHQTSGADWPAAAVAQVHLFADAQWHEGGTAGVEHLLEDGGVLSFPRMRFAVGDAERRLLDGARRDAQRTMATRYAEHSEALLLRLFPHYRGHLRRGRTLYHPAGPATGETGWRRDDTRLHVDADAAHPTHGARLLHVFSNLDPGGTSHRGASASTSPRTRGATSRR